MALKAKIGRILTSIFTKKNGFDVLEVKAELNKDENITAERYSPSGDDSVPLPDDAGCFIPRDESGVYLVNGFIDPKNKSVSLPGEKRFYSRDDSGNIKAYIYLRKDEIIELNGNEDFAVRFLVLEAEFNKLKDSYNDLVEKYNQHTHLYNPGPGSPTASGAASDQGTESTADISGAKVENVKVS